MKLTIELVPKTSWYSNVRSNVTTAQWDSIRKKCYARAKFKCELCGDVGTNQGFKHPVECHEIWHYDDEKLIQKLNGLIALCPNCHSVKHIGLSQLKGRGEIAIQQLMKVNNMTREEAYSYIKKSFELWSKRSQFDWTLDISELDKQIKT
jgi:Zn finger protein HypA/HybF involved in hydrogenase expression